MAHNPPATKMLILIVPGIYSLSIPTLSPEQLNRLPENVVSSLYALGKSEDQGDIILLRIKKSKFEKHHDFITWSIQWAKYGENAACVQHDGLQVVSESNPSEPVLYVPKLHDRESNFASTDSTLRHFRQRIDMYMFSVENGLEDLKALLSAQFVSSLWPVYENETLDMLTCLASADLLKDLHITDPSLAEFIGRRVQRFRDTLVETMLDFLTPRRCVTPKARLQLMASIVPDNVAEEAADGLCSLVADGAEIKLLLDTFVANACSHGSSDPSMPSTPTSQSSSSTTEYASPVSTFESPIQMSFA